MIFNLFGYNIAHDHPLLGYLYFEILSIIFYNFAKESHSYHFSVQTFTYLLIRALKMKVRLISTCMLLLSAFSAAAQSSDFSFKFYGRIRADIFYNSRANEETVDGLFYMYPKDRAYDADGEDLNATPQGSMYVLYSRLGMDIAGPRLGAASTSAKIELDFRGSGSTYAIARLRQAYIAFGWRTSQLLIGQTWHPMYGEVTPSILNLSSGAPFQPFNRGPMIRYRYFTGSHWQLTGATVWQMQYNSTGPIGKSHTYLKNSGIPELFVGADYVHGGLRMGAGAEFLSIMPRQKSEIDGKTYKVSERVNSFSAEAHIKYTAPMWMASAKTVYANNLAHLSMLGGYAVTGIDPRTGECKYKPFRHSMTWANFVYGRKWQPGVFIGYLKNLGTGHAIAGSTYGVGLDVDQLMSSGWQISYNLPSWKFGVEFSASTAWYGSLNTANGRVTDTHHVTNCRALATAMFMF